MKNIFKKALLVIALVGLITSCTNTDDFTDDSTMVATNPALDVALSFDNAVTLVEDDVVYPFTINLSEAQIVDVKVLLSKTDGTATEGEDFTFPHEIIIPKGSTSVSGEIGIIKDTDFETTEDFYFDHSLWGYSQRCNCKFQNCDVYHSEFCLKRTGNDL